MISNLENQLKLFNKYKSTNESGGPINKKDMFEWIINFDGPIDSDYEGGKFHVKVKFDDKNYEKRPLCKFLSGDLLHPNITDKGDVCFGTNFPWTKESTIFDILNALYFLLKNPNFGDGYDNQQVKDFYDSDPVAYHRTVKEIVKEFHQK